MTKTPMIEVLQASKPLPELAEKLQPFGQFVGSWNVRVINYKPDGSSQTVEAEWHFGWVLEGRAIQDVLIAPKRGLRVAGENAPGDYEATLRFYDPKIDGLFNFGAHYEGEAPQITFPSGEIIGGDNPSVHSELSRALDKK